MKNIGIITNTSKDADLAFTKTIIDWILEKGCNPILTEEITNKLHLEQLYSKEDFFKQSDFLIVLGGDGTILKTAGGASKYNVPLLGINLGTLGYLTDVENKEAFIALEKVLNGDYKLEKRMMLEASCSENEKLCEPFFALNEFCILKGTLSKLITAKLYINEDYIDTYRADGILISSPTGSTAYNLSAGGPILKPDSHMIAVTPICPHTLYARPFVISSEDTVTIIGINNFENEMLLSKDGQNVGRLNDGEILSVSCSKFYTTIIKTKGLGFYDILRQKMVRM